MASLPPGYFLQSLLEAGNEPLIRPSVPNPEGGMSTVFSEGADFDGENVLYPRTADNKIYNSRDAQDRYLNTNGFLGKFATQEASDRYGQMLHEDQQNNQFGQPEENGSWITPSWKSQMLRAIRAQMLKPKLNPLVSFFHLGNE